MWERCYCGSGNDGLNFKGVDLNSCGTSDEDAQYGSYRACIHESYTENTDFSDGSWE